MMLVLFLNDMRSPKCEITQPVARAETREAIESFLRREAVDQYRDGPWVKSFRAGGPLEWFNPPECFGTLRDIGTADDAKRRWEEEVGRIPLVT